MKNSKDSKSKESLFRWKIIRAKDNSEFSLDNSDYCMLLARKIVISQKVLLPFGYSQNLYQKLFGFDPGHRPLYDSWKHVFFDRNSLKKELEQVKKQLSQDPNYLDRVAERCEHDADALLSFSKKIKKSDCSKLDDAELKKTVKRLFELIIGLSAYLALPISIQEFLEDNVRDELKARIKDEKKVEDKYNALMTPIKQNTGYFEQLEILQFALQYKKAGKFTQEFEKKIEQYLFDFDSQGVKYGYGRVWTREDIKERIIYLAKTVSIEKLSGLKSLPKLHDEKAEQVLAGLNADRNFRDTVRWARTYMYIRTLRTDIINFGFTNSFNLFREIGKRNNLELEEVIECTPEEISTFNFPDKKHILARAKSSIFQGFNGKIIYIEGKPAEELRDRILKEKADENTTATLKEIKGNTANKGFVKGTVKVIEDNSQFAKVKHGDILVAAMTTPDFVSVMEKAAAFVTDEGGLLCHAAIVSREMKKPCIIGTKIATRVLRDGDLVEVDADSGVVRIVKRA